MRHYGYVSKITIAALIHLTIHIISGDCLYIWKLCNGNMYASDIEVALVGVCIVLD